MPTTKGSYDVAAATASQFPAAGKIDLLEKIARFLGFRKVRVVTPTDIYLPSGAEVDDVSIRQRVVASAIPNASVRNQEETPDSPAMSVADWTGMFQHNYVGHRANRQNLGTLFQDVVRSGVGRRENESDSLYQTRIRLGLVASGMANLDENGQLSSRRHANRPLTVSQFRALSSVLTGSAAQLMDAAAERKQLTSWHLTNTSWGGELLGATAGLCAIESGEDVYKRQRLLRQYFVSGEGNARLKALEFPGVDKLGQFLSGDIIQLGALEDHEKLPITHSLKSALREDATEARTDSEVEFVTDKDGNRTKVVKDYDPANTDLRCLALLQEMYYLNSGYSSCLLQRYAEEPEKVQAIRDYKANLAGAYMGASHCIMRNALPEQMKKESYEQVVLRNSDGVAQWNSDMAQPRKRWLGEVPLAPFEA